MTTFKPEPRTNVKTVRHINYTCGPERYATLEAIAKTAGIGLKELLRQMVEFALANYPSGQSWCPDVENHKPGVICMECRADGRQLLRRMTALDEELGLYNDEAVPAARQALADPSPDKGQR